MLVFDALMIKALIQSFQAGCGVKVQVNLLDLSLVKDLIGAFRDGLEVVLVAKAQVFEV